MAGGIMGKLSLDISSVMKSIDDLKNGLANLGKGGGGTGGIHVPGIDDLKKDLQSVLPLLNQIDTQLKSLGSGGSGGGGVEQQSAKVRELVR